MTDSYQLIGTTSVLLTYPYFLYLFFEKLFLFLIFIDFVHFMPAQNKNKMVLKYFSTHPHSSLIKVCEFDMIAAAVSQAGCLISTTFHSSSEFLTFYTPILEIYGFYPDIFPPLKTIETISFSFSRLAISPKEFREIYFNCPLIWPPMCHY